ncbi:MAG: hypothetical protein MH219_20395 [Marinobacter sp.]|jgi:hypothetical protein|nr:hypothetical protein [Marinobacter sp.]MCL1481504.1 hypothetical protein [Marinobacter sp.]
MRKYLTEKEQARNEFIDFLQKQPTRYHLTVSFTEGTNRKMCIRLLNIFVKHLNTYILKNRFTKYDQKIAGFVVLEPTRSLNTDHFHIFIFDEDNKLCDFDRLEEIIDKKIISANRSIGNQRYKIKKSYLQNYYKTVKENKNEKEERRSLEEYLTKNFERYDLSINEMLSTLCPLDAESISFS